MSQFDFMKLVSELPVSDHDFEFKKPIEIIFKGERTHFLTYTLKKMTGNSEKKIFKLYKKSTIDLSEVISELLIKIDGKPITPAEALTIVKAMPHTEYELMVLNMRVISYGDKLTLTPTCQNEVPKKDEMGRVEKDEFGKTIMVKCEHQNKIEQFLNDSIYKKDEELSVNETENITYEPNSFIKMVFEAKPFVKTLNDGDYVKKIPADKLETYNSEIELAASLKKISFFKDGELKEEIPVSIDAIFFNKNGAFDAVSETAKGFIELNKKLDITIIKKIREAAAKLQSDTSYLNLKYSCVCSKCGQTIKGEIAMGSPDFLLPKMD